METKIIIESLDNTSVSIVKKNFIIDEGKEYYIGKPHRCSYTNDEQGRELLREQVSDPYYSSIMEIWGDSPSIVREIDEQISS